MATTGVINGKLLGVDVDGTLIATAKSCKLTITMEPRETTSKDDSGWDTKAEGKRSWKVDVDGLVTMTNFKALFALMTSRTKVYLSFESSVSGDNHYRGYAYLSSLDQNADNETSVSFTASFDGTGTLTEGTLT